jgi:glucose-6-phosphate isomerase
MSIRFAIPSDLRGAADAAVADWQANRKIERFWQKDSSLWTSAGEERWLGWINIVERQQKDAASFAALAADVKAAGFKSVLLLGMGGSSLCPEVLAETFGPQPGFPVLHIVDSTDPAQVKAARERVNLAETLAVVASKSGSTLEPNILKQYFFEEMKKAVGAGKAGDHFIAVTDPGSKMEMVAKTDGFRRIFYGDPQIGGRYSALSNFGVVAATVAGLDTNRLLAEAAKAVLSAHEPVENNPAVRLGALMGAAANAGRDKITIFTSPEIYDLGAWLEQLIAESTGKLGKGITPVDRETIGGAELYGKDRIFVYVRLQNTADASQDAKVAAIEAAGHPVVRIELADRYEIFGQFFTWEVATAVAGSVMGINPFDQPDVESAKVETRALTAAYRFWLMAASRSTPPMPMRPSSRLALRWPACCARISVSCRPVTISPRWLFCLCSRSTRRRFRASGTRCARPSAWPPAWASDRAFCTPPVRITRVGRTRAFSCRLLPIMRWTWRFPTRSTALAW